MLLIYADGRSKPQVFTDVNTAKRQVEQAHCVTEDEIPAWYEHADRWILTARWRSTVAIVWKVQVEQ